MTLVEKAQAWLDGRGKYKDSERPVDILCSVFAEGILAEHGRRYRLEAEIVQLRTQAEKDRGKIERLGDENANFRNMMEIARMWLDYKCECHEPEYKDEGIKCWDCRAKAALKPCGGDGEI